jgi:transcription initiation factor TFIIB
MLNVKIKNVKNTKRKKKKKKKEDLWDAFDHEYNTKTQSLELMYSNQSNSSRENCELCNSPLQYAESNYLTCSNNKCSVIYKDSLDQTAEWRFYGADDSSSRDPTRCGMPVNHLLKESSYGCKVICNGKSSYEMRKIKRYTEWQSMPYKEKSQYDEFEHIKAMSRIAGIPKMIQDEALRQHKIISEMRTFRGFNREGVIAASVYIACRIHNYPRTAKEIATVFKLDATSATKGCKHAVHLLEKNETGLENNEKTHFHRTKPIAFIERYCSRLNMNSELIKLCKFVAMKIEKNNIIPENTPHSVAAGIVYFVAQCCNLNITKKQVNSYSEISEVTINKCYKKLDKIKDTLIPKSIISKYSL